MFLRTSSTAFNSQTKSVIFPCRLHNSYQFFGHRSSICNASFSRMITFTAGYAFVNNSTTGNWRNQVAFTLFNGTGLQESQFKFDGSGDSGDFECICCNHTLKDERVFKSIGILEATEPNHDLAMRNVGWRSQGMADFESVVENLAYGYLESEYGGWEINSGSNGMVTLNVLDGMEIDYNENTYYCDVCHEEYTDDEPCSCIKCPDCYESIDEDGECSNCDTKLITCKGISKEEPCSLEWDATENNPICDNCRRVLESRKESKKKEVQK